MSTSFYNKPKSSFGFIGESIIKNDELKSVFKNDHYKSTYNNHFDKQG